MQEMWVRSLGQEDPLEVELATHSQEISSMQTDKRSAGKTEALSFSMIRTISHHFNFLGF